MVFVSGKGFIKRYQLYIQYVQNALKNFQRRIHPASYKLYQKQKVYRKRGKKARNLHLYFIRYCVR